MGDFLRYAAPAALLGFAPELFTGRSCCARFLPDADSTLHEETDRYAQALLCNRIAADCFTSALERTTLLNRKRHKRCKTKYERFINECEKISPHTSVKINQSAPKWLLEPNQPPSPLCPSKIPPPANDC